MLCIDATSPAGSLPTGLVLIRILLGGGRRPGGRGGIRTNRAYCAGRTVADKIAYQMAGSGAAIIYGKLNRVSNQGAAVSFARPETAGNMEISRCWRRSLRFFEILWAAQRYGFYYASYAGRDCLYRHGL
jgi:hypothetical protein